jgi:hypothetical protein
MENSERKLDMLVKVHIPASGEWRYASMRMSLGANNKLVRIVDYDNTSTWDDLEEAIK